MEVLLLISQISFAIRRWLYRYIECEATDSGERFTHIRRKSAHTLRNHAAASLEIPRWKVLY
ncbi:MAG: hypothetical protein DMG72_16360 [Acidobacteria bacterium]|nr:MAG: hypothetical protein DMG72_16360 [Acidobacteriota bacterium]